MNGAPTSFDARARSGSGEETPMRRHERNGVWGAVAAFGLALSGCASVVESRLTLDEYGLETARAFCDVFEACYGPTVTELFAGSDCEGRYAAFFADQALPRWEAAVANGSVTFDGARAAACVRALREAGCGLVDRVALADCDAAFVGTAAAGDACSIDEQCDGDSFCRIDGMCPGSCQARVDAGSACRADGDCQSGLRCFAGSCRAPAGPSAACGGDTGIQCRGGLICLGEQAASSGMPARTGSCTDPATVLIGTEGASCELSARGPLCAEGLSCALTGVMGTSGVFECRAEAPRDGACFLALPDMCPPDQYCDAQPFAGGMLGRFEGTCVLLPDDGAPCAGDAGRCAEGLGCVSGTCRAPQAVGFACAVGGECRSGQCESGVCVTASLCGP